MNNKGDYGQEFKETVLKRLLPPENATVYYENSFMNEIFLNSHISVKLSRKITHVKNGTDNNGLNRW